MGLIRGRKLTDQQQRRMQEQQDKRQKNRDSAPDNGQLSSPMQGRVVSHFGRQLVVMGLESPFANTEVRCHVRTNLQALVTGDLVVWQFDEQNNIGVVIAQHPRDNLLERPDRYGKLKPVVANIDVLIVVLCPYPESAWLLIDKYLVAAELANMPVVLLLNKTDLLEATSPLQQQLSDYRAIGYPTMAHSSHTPHTLQALQDYIGGKTIAFVGQSGVGKSSIINALLPGAAQKINDVSANSALGQHTTTSTRYLPLQGGGAVIDSPGIREFGLWHLGVEAIQQGFVDLRQWYGECKYRNCLHTHPTGCAVHQAVADGKALPKRLDSLVRLTQEALDGVN